MERQVSRRIPVLKLPAKDRASDEHKDFDTPRTSETESGTSVSSATIDSKCSVFSSSSSAAENVSRSAVITTSGKVRTSGHKDIVKKPRLHKHSKDSLLASPTEARRSQNTAGFGIESLGCKTPAKVTYVGSGLMPLSSPLLSNVGQTTVLSYAIYTPLILSGQSQSRSQLMGVSSPLHVAKHLPAAISSTAVQTLTVADASVCSVDSTVSTRVVENAPVIDSVQSPSGSQLIDVSSPLHRASRLPTSTDSANVQTLTTTDADVCSVDSSFSTRVVENAPVIDSVQSPSGSQLIDVSSPLHRASRLPTSADSANVQSLTTTDADVCSVDASVIDTEVVETVHKQFSLDHTCKRKKQKQIVKTGRDDV